MDTCDVLIVGGGPGGSACAWKLHQAGVDVMVVDKAAFPRDKVCAGWITPQVIDDLQIDVDEYRTSRTFQAITGFRVGVIGDARMVTTRYERPVSYGIRRCEFDQYLLQRSSARLLLGASVSSIRRDRVGWIINETIRAPMLVGAGGHFCPVGRMLNGHVGLMPAVAAQETELRIDSTRAGGFTIDAEKPELYFSRDLAGYGWCVRKQNYLNVGFGRINARALPNETARFIAFLAAAGKICSSAPWRWRGHAYLLSNAIRHHLVGDGVMLIGDSAGLAYAESGEGIRPAIESGLLAASTIIESDGRYDHERLDAYIDRLRERFGLGSIGRMVSQLVPPAISRAAGRRLLTSGWFVRHVVLGRWFLHSREPALSAT